MVNNLMPRDGLVERIGPSQNDYELLRRCLDILLLPDDRSHEIAREVIRKIMFPVAIVTNPR